VLHMRGRSSDRYHDDDTMSVACIDTDFKAVHPDGSSCCHYLTKHCGNYDGLDVNSVTLCCICGGEAVTATSTTKRRPGGQGQFWHDLLRLGSSQRPGGGRG
jgi:hypothetical protein